MDTLPDEILYPFLDQVINIRGTLRRASPGDTGYFAQIDTALGYCMPHFVLRYVKEEDPEMIRCAKAHKSVFGLMLFNLQEDELQNAYSRLVDYLRARNSSFEAIHWLAQNLPAKLDPMTAAPLDLVICDCLVELSLQAGKP